MSEKSMNTIGVKILDPEMMEANFKHTESVLRSIENCRFVAKEKQDEFNSLLIKNPDDAVMAAKGYNNAISILGSRGSGKTSIIMTLQHILMYGYDTWRKGELKKENSNLQDIKELRENIIMPILVPQDFVRGQDLLSWIFVQLLRKAEEVEKDINQCGNIPLGKQGLFSRWAENKCNKQFSDPLRKCMDDLKSSYELRYKIIKQSNNQTNHVYQYMDEVKRDANLVQEMLRLISMLTDYYRYILEKEPLIFFVIDDLDLAPERSQEVLNLVLRYLQHPNIVVLCGWNQELFQTHLTMEVLRNQGVTDAGMVDANGDYVDVFMTRQRKKVSLLDSARRLSMDNLKKAFPPALRYEVRGLDTEQRANFPSVVFTEYTGKDSHGSLIDLIEKALLASRSPARRKTDEKSENKVEFLHNRQNEFIKVYMRIFDNKCRGLINTYHAFEMLKEFFDNRDWNAKKDVTSVMRSLLDTILFSNTHFFPYRRGLRDLIRIEQIVLQPKDSKESNVCKYYCNYQQVVPVLYKYREKQAMTENDTYITDDEYKVESEYNYFPSLIIDVFILLNFMQNFLRYICNLPIYEHGGVAFSSALSDVIPPIYINTHYDNLLSFAIMSANIKEIPLFPDTDNFRINLELLDAYEKAHFQDGRYDFTGSYSYCQLSRAIIRLFDIEKLKNKSKVDENDHITKKIYSKLMKSPWMRTMSNLFLALAFNENNVERLSRYRCFSIQGIFNEEEMIRESSTPTIISANNRESLGLNNKMKGDISNTTNDILDHLVYSLRELDLLEESILKPKGIKGEELWNSIKNDSETFEKYMKTKEIAEKLTEYINQPHKWIYDPKGLYYQILVISNSKVSKRTTKNPDSYPEEYVEQCDKCMKSMKKNLLWNIRVRMNHAFYDVYDSKQAAAEKYEYLLKASSAISRYMERWEIGSQIWSLAEQEAVEKLFEIFQGIGRIEANRYVRIIAQNGPSSDESSQEEYEIALEGLKLWLINNERHIRPARRNDIEDQLRILQRSAKRETKHYSIDNDIKMELADLGRLIAEECARIAYDEELTKDASSNERDRISWPIIEDYREAFAIWQTIDTDNPDKSKYTTYFD